jgi:CRISPR/Cas system-associated exonuclease Cas4 (RecB family)
MTLSLEELLAQSVAFVTARKTKEAAPANLFLMPSPAAPPPDSEIPSRLSPSSVNCFGDCSARWFYRKVLKLPETRGAALGLGTAVHHALIENFRQKIETRVDLPAEDVRGLFVGALCDELDSGLKLLAGESADELKESGEVMVRVYMDQAAPQVQPAAVEEHVEGEIGGVPVHGYIDVRTIEGRVIDIKTAKRKPTGITPAHRLQAGTYVLLHPEASGEATISTLTKTKTVALQQDSMTILPPDRKLIEKLYSITRDQMQTGLVAPNRASFLCGKYCSFKGRCADDYGGTFAPEVDA